MSDQQGGHGYRDPYGDGVPQYGSAGGSGGQPFNPLMYNFNNKGGGPTQAADKLTMRKQGNPTTVASPPQHTYYTGGYQSGQYYQGNYDPRYTAQQPQPQSQLQPQGQGQLQGQPRQSHPPRDLHIDDRQQVGHSSQPSPATRPTPAVIAAAGAAKVAVEYETEYPRPHKGDGLLSIFFSDPGKFEGRLRLR